MTGRSRALVALAALATGTALGLAPAAHATAKREFTPGAPGVGDDYFPDAGNGGYDVGHYALDLTYDPATTRISATARILARTTQDLSRFDLDYRGPAITSVSVDGAPAAYTRSGQELIVSPDHGIPAGTDFQVDVAYAGEPHPLDEPDLGMYGWVPTDDGAVVVSEPNGAPTWFPDNDTPTDKATYTIRVTVPKGLTVLSNGDLVAEHDTDTTSTFVWNEREPMATYLATVAIGRFDVTRGRTPGGIPELTAVAAVHHDKAAYLAATTAAATDWESRTFGPYPFSSTGGIRIGADLGYSLETQTRPIYAYDPDTPTIVHELAHQWFGDAVSVRYWHDIWLNEGFATYAEWLYAEQHGGKTAEEVFRSLYRLPASSPVWSPVPGDPGRADLFASSVYYRGAMTLQALRDRVGDQAFFTILRTWTLSHRYATGTTPQFIALAEQVSGQNLADLFEAWLYQPGKPSVTDLQAPLALAGGATRP